MTCRPKLVQTTQYTSLWSNSQSWDTDLNHNIHSIPCGSILLVLGTAYYEDMEWATYKVVYQTHIGYVTIDHVKNVL